ncbi:Putative AC transposase [Linum grandiflorum]
MVITAHFIDDNWILQSRILRFVYVPSPHTKDVICEVLFECLIEWDIDRKLKKFHEATKAFSGTSYPTSNALFPLICEVKIDLREWVMTSNGTIKRMAEQMLIKFDRYWEVIEGPLAIAVVLDPRYRLKMVEWAFAIIYGDRARSELDKIKYLIHDLLDEYKKIEESSDISSSSVHPLGPGGSTFLSGFKSFVVDSTMSNQNGREELEKYLKESLFPRTQPFDILGWCKNQEVNYPTLRLIAKDILAIPVSTVVSESAFSTSGRLLRANRSTLDPLTIEALMCTQNWLRNEINGNGQIVITTLLALILVVPFTLLFTLWIFVGEKGDSSKASCLTRSIYDSDFLDNIDVIE